MTDLAPKEVMLRELEAQVRGCWGGGKGRDMEEGLVRRPERAVREEVCAWGCGAAGAF